MTGQRLGKTIIAAVENAGLDTSACMGQEYDGASIMSSDVKGAATVLLEKNPLALYIHCCSHSLNLALVKTSKLTAVRNMYGCFQSVVDFLNSSGKRRALFMAAVKFKCPQSIQTD